MMRSGEFSAKISPPPLFAFTPSILVMLSIASPTSLIPSFRELEDPPICMEILRVVYILRVHPRLQTR